MKVKPVSYLRLFFLRFGWTQTSFLNNSEWCFPVFFLLNFTWVGEKRRSHHQSNWFQNMWKTNWEKPKVTLLTQRFCLRVVKVFFFFSFIEIVFLLVCILVDLPLSSMTSIPPAVISTRSKMPFRKGGGKDVRCSGETLCCLVKQHIGPVQNHQTSFHCLPRVQSSRSAVCI